MRRCYVITLLAFIASLPIVNIRHVLTLNDDAIVIIDHPQQNAVLTFSPKSLPPASSFGACIMMKEDNDLLYEWIAYHYLMLPLRYLVVGSDEGNTHNPLDVLQRWNGTGLNYWVLNSTDFVGRHGPSRRDKKNDPHFHHHQFIHRQRGFVTTCAEFLEEKGIHWMTLIDSDEFIVLNRFNNDDTVDDYHTIQAQNTTYKMRQLLSSPEAERYTALDVIHKIEQDIQPIDPCTLMPRLRFGALEGISCTDASNVNELAKRDYNHAAMSTLRYKQHAGKNTFSANKFGKVMVDLSQIPNVSAEVPKNIHRPFKNECPYPVTWFQDALFSINHYTASWERYSHRQDERRNCENWIELAFHDHGDSCEQRIHTWFPRFVEEVGGHERAKYLLGVDATKQIIQTTKEKKCPPKNFDFSKLQKKYGWNISNLVV
jgi:hypothetical protein